MKKKFPDSFWDGKDKFRLCDRKKSAVESLEEFPLECQTWMTGATRRKDPHAQERKLAYAVLEEALLCLGGTPSSPDRFTDASYEQKLAGQWFREKGDPFKAMSFYWVCMVLSIDPWRVIQAIDLLGAVGLARRMQKERKAQGPIGYKKTGTGGWR